MTGRVHWSRWVGTLSLAFSGGSFAMASEPGVGEADTAYRMTLQILGGMSSCTDRHSGPEYYGSAKRRDPQVEKDLDRIRGELENLQPRIEAFDERIEPLLPRENNTVPLTDDELRELEELRERSPELERLLKEAESGSEERSALLTEKSRLNRSVQRLEDSVPLTDEEARFLRDQKAQREPLVARRSVLKTRQGALRALVSMTTPGSLRVYANDSLSLSLMEKDVFADDTCATWQLTLDREILQKGGVDLEHDDRPLLRLWVQPVPVSFDDGAPE